jgi:hypothetical protein
MAWKAMVRYISNAKMSLPQIHDELESSLGHSRYEKEALIWSKALDALDHSLMDEVQLLQKCREERDKYFVSAIPFQCTSECTHKKESSQASHGEASSAGEGGMQV